MANELTAFTNNVPAFVSRAKEAGSKGILAEVSFGGPTYPVIATKGKSWILKRDDEQEVIMKPDAPDEPAASLELVILDVGPSPDMRVNNRVFYIEKYEPGSKAKPDCSSSNGVSPDAHITTPQSKQCATCPQNVSGTSATGKGKACASTKRLAVATPDNLGEPMLLKVPPTSLIALNDYFKWMKQKGVTNPAHIVTKIGFDYSVDHPSFTFKGLGWALHDPADAQASEVVGHITGKTYVAPEADENPFESPRPDFAAAEETPKRPPAKEAPKAETKSRAASKKKEDDDLPSEPKVKTEVKVEPTATVEPAVAEAGDDFDAALDDLDFDA